ncbi:uncharacterized protein LOC121860538 isoform X2 [Homarus americanus]|uniref:uncharacterized protein LOC121860538 isoform X2 n=1 Tax=Homarus americanus TaxID=6706 RepID=UPI001C467831|nr:uncharacterized protein LOC121860538 isoform X2 [Homarus americanus]
MKYGINTTSDETVIDSIEKEQLTESNGSRIAPFMAASAGEAPMANSTKVTPKCDVDAVVFSIQFYGKTLGEVGLMDQDLAKLDWKKFKSYLFQNLLSMNHQENICVSYNDDEGDKLPIESEEEYREALKIAKKKAEAHDKMVLDITRQGGLPTMLSFVSSGIKRVSSSPPKEGGISFFKASSPPKDSQGFVAKAVGSERKLFPGFFSPDRGGGQLPGGGARPRVTQKQRCITELPPEWFTSYMTKFRVELREELSQQVAMKVTEILKDVKNISSTYADEHSAESLNNQTLQFHFDDNGTQIASHQIFPVKEAVDKQLPVIANPVRAYLDSTCSKSILKPKEKEKLEDIQSNMKASDETRIQKMKEKIEGADTGAKRKKLAKEEEKLIKKQERLDERLTKKQEKLEERLTKKQEKVEERFLKKQEKLAERIFKQQEKVERKKLTSK